MKRRALFVLVAAVFLLFVVVAVEAETITYEFTLSSAGFSFDFGTGTNIQTGYFSYDNDVLVPLYNGLGYRVINFELEGLHLKPERDVYWAPQPQSDGSTIEIFSSGKNDQWVLFDDDEVLRFQLVAYPDGAGGFIGYIAENFTGADVATVTYTEVPNIIYVDADANGLNDGSSWTNAYNHVGLAMDCIEGSDVNEVRVAQGIYRLPTWSRREHFWLLNGVTVKGGYAGLGEPDPNARDIEKYKTILSGDQLGNDREISDPCELLNDPCRADNSYHVIICIDNDATAVLDGFIITGGNANGDDYWVNGCGGGMFNISRFPTLVNCTFVGNTAKWGGGMDNYESGVTLINCTFSGNHATERGGGMNSDVYPCFITLTNCTFIGNRSGEDGGGMYNGFESEITFTNCTFAGNSAVRYGGAMCNNRGIGELTNCSFSGNLSSEQGGAICNIAGLSWLYNCTFAQNSAPDGEALACDTDSFYSSWAFISNCILWDGGNEIWDNDGSPITITYSDVQGGQTGIYDPCGGVAWSSGNMDADPCFAEPGYWDPNGTPSDVNDDFWVVGDYHLQSEAGRWNSNSQSWVIDSNTSPCIDAGDMASPIGYEPFPNGGRINMGAYGGTAEASKSYFGTEPCETIVAGDINGDCKVDFIDLAIMALHWQQNKII